MYDYKIEVSSDKNSHSKKAIDLSQSPGERSKFSNFLPENISQTALVPLVFNNENFCGDFENFQEFSELDQLYQFFHLEPPNGSAEEKHRLKFLETCV